MQLLSQIGYAESLKELERISEEIHERRGKYRQYYNILGNRGEGVGAEFPDQGNDTPTGEAGTSSGSPKPDLPGADHGE